MKKKIKSINLFVGFIMLALGIYLAIVDPKNIVNNGILGMAIMWTCLALRSMDSEINQPKYIKL